MAPVSFSRSLTRILPPSLTLVALTASALVYRELPSEVPIHWTLGLDADQFGSKGALALALPGAMAINWLALGVMMRSGPSGSAPPPRWLPFALLVLPSVVLLLLHLWLLAQGTSWTPTPANILGIGTGVLQIMFGLSMPLVRPNSLVGLRTSATLGNPQVWRHVHDVGGAVTVATGFLAVAVGMFMHPAWASEAAAAVFIITSLALIRYSTLVAGRYLTNAAQHVRDEQT